MHEITVNEQKQRFYIANMSKNEWVLVVGHEIKVEKYQFCAIPFEDGINVSEVSSGAKLMEIPYSYGMSQAVRDKAGAMELFKNIGESVNRIIEKQDNFDSTIEDLRNIAFNRLGEKPATEPVKS